MAEPTDTPKWIWQQPGWPAIQWQADVLAPSLREVVQLQGKLLGLIGSVGEDTRKAELDAMLQNILQSSAIEGENLNEVSVRSSLAKRLGLEHAGLPPGNAKTEGVVVIQLDATQHYEKPLTLERLYDWHRLLFLSEEAGEYRSHNLNIGALRSDAPMQVVSGPINKPTVHFEAPPRDGLEGELNAFLEWLSNSRNQPSLDPILRAAIAHLWFVTVHPFDDGNGRLARAITDHALAQAEHQSVRFYAMAASIMEKRNEYYRILETTQKGGLDITPWCQWFLATLKHTLEHALVRIDLVVQKARFWQVHGQQGLNAQQVKVLSLLDTGLEGFEGGLTASKYKSMAKVSKATATRHLAELLEKGCIVKQEGGGRSTRYQINWLGK